MGSDKMIEFALTLAVLEYWLFPTYVVVDYNSRVVKTYQMLNSEAQCKQYARWKGHKYECVKVE